MPGIPISGIDVATPWGLAVLCFVALVTGWLVPRWMHKQRIEDYKDQNNLLRQQVERRDEQITKSLENNTLVVQLLEGIRNEVSRR